MRDTEICLGGDGRYYLTGSTGADIWHFNDGVELWVSDDLKKWDYLGLVFSIEKDGTWEKRWKFHHKATRALWAPEIRGKVGIPDASQFNVAFKRKFGVAPSKYGKEQPARQ